MGLGVDHHQAHQEVPAVEVDCVLGGQLLDAERSVIDVELDRPFAGNDEVDDAVGDHHVGEDDRVAVAWELGGELHGSVARLVCAAPFDVLHRVDVERDCNVRVARQDLRTTHAVLGQVLPDLLQRDGGQREAGICAAVIVGMRPRVARALDAVIAEVYRILLHRAVRGALAVYGRQFRAAYQRQMSEPVVVVVDSGCVVGVVLPAGREVERSGQVPDGRFECADIADVYYGLCAARCEAPELVVYRIARGLYIVSQSVAAVHCADRLVDEQRVVVYQLGVRRVEQSYIVCAAAFDDVQTGRVGEPVGRHTREVERVACADRDFLALHRAVVECDCEDGFSVTVVCQPGSKRVVRVTYRNAEAQPVEVERNRAEVAGARSERVVVASIGRTFRRGVTVPVRSPEPVFPHGAVERETVGIDSGRQDFGHVLVEFAATKTAAVPLVECEPHAVHGVVVEYAAMHVVLDLRSLRGVDALGGCTGHKVEHLGGAVEIVELLPQVVDLEEAFQEPVLDVHLERPTGQLTLDDAELSEQV
ncbi:MAG: hypothetical protein KatS3mg087_0513 [Patescibacteria group bacterium]|nr:MAG: hypothetical protein KatS3mg087_0513 [Patescibacteria group bacterium]